MTEINRDWYCSAGNFKSINCFCFHGECKPDKAKCNCLHRKHPTPAEFLAEYGHEWEGPVYFKCTSKHCPKGEYCHTEKWFTYSSIRAANFDMCNEAKERSIPLITCAATPWGKPDDGWRPE